ncbi:MAG: hypothetical protein J0I47_02980 [Sphingomonas sp.]|uniref:hypothetical protein n=1 Tax=Sphingomonas sp. TaxID=28214 RepID=UPI001AD3EFA3|nr:hypothetical protein [Sphingomonas sp.]MBN8807190.1 hypothetical protein [Sphingomonas sp.]
MSTRGPIWRSILWVEQFLPKPTPALPESERAAARRRAAFVPLIAFPAIFVPSLLRNRHELGTLLRQNMVAVQQAFLGLAVICALAVMVAAIVTLRRERRRELGR